MSARAMHGWVALGLCFALLAACSGRSRILSVQGISASASEQRLLVAVGNLELLQEGDPHSSMRSWQLPMLVHVLSANQEGLQVEAILSPPAGEAVFAAAPDAGTILGPQVVSSSEAGQFPVVRYYLGGPPAQERDAILGMDGGYTLADAAEGTPLAGGRRVLALTDGVEVRDEKGQVEWHHTFPAVQLEVCPQAASDLRTEAPQVERSASAQFAVAFRLGLAWDWKAGGECTESVLQVARWSADGSRRGAWELRWSRPVLAGSEAVKVAVQDDGSFLVLEARADHVMHSAEEMEKGENGFHREDLKTRSTSFAADGTQRSAEHDGLGLDLAAAGTHWAVRVRHEDSASSSQSLVVIDSSGKQLGSTSILAGDRALLRSASGGALLVQAEPYHEENRLHVWLMKEDGSVDWHHDLDLLEYR